MKSIWLSLLKTTGWTVAVALGSAMAAQAQEGVMNFGKVKLQGPPASDVEHPKEPYVFGQFLNVNPKDGPLRIHAKVKDARGEWVEAVIEVRGAIDDITRIKTFPVGQYKDTPGKAYVEYRGQNLVCVPKNGGSVNFKTVGKEGEVVSGSFNGVKFFDNACPPGAGTFTVTRAENY